MTGQKVRAEKSQINVSTLIEFAESFIDGSDPELDLSSLTEMFADSIAVFAQQINIPANNGAVKIDVLD